MELVWLRYYPFCLQPFDSSTKTKCMLFAPDPTLIELLSGLDLGPPVVATQKKKKSKKKKK